MRFFSIFLLVAYDSGMENYKYPDDLFEEALDAFVGAAQEGKLAKMQDIRFDRIAPSKEQVEKLYSACEQYMPRLWDVVLDKVTLDYETALVLSKFAQMTNERAAVVFAGEKHIPQGGCYFNVTSGLTDDQIKQLNDQIGREAFVNKSKR